MTAIRCFALAALPALLLLAGPATAQGPILRTPPPSFGGPPVYDLFRRQTGLLPNYYQFYLPRQQLERTLRLQDYQLQGQGTAIRAMQNQWQQAQSGQQPLQPTGSGSVYMNYSHFYPSPGGKPVQRPRR